MTRSEFPLYFSVVARKDDVRLAPCGSSREKQRGGVFFRLIFLGFVVVFCFLVYLARHPLLRMAGHFWIVDDAPVVSDAILVLGDDNYHGERAEHAAQLYRAGWAPRVVASGRVLRPYASIAELEEHDLKDRGVPQAAIVRLTHRADNTREEALELARLIRERGWRRVLLVTSNYHTRRARYICGHLFPPGTALRVEAAPDSEFDPDGWWQDRKGLTLFFHESVGYVVAMWEIHWSATPQTSVILGVSKAAMSISRQHTPPGLQAFNSVL
jgi:uncharacterized SAM-binding protein YcdF (DUF218 family)